MEWFAACFTLRFRFITGLRCLSLALAFQYGHGLPACWVIQPEKLGDDLSSGFFFFFSGKNPKVNTKEINNHSTAYWVMLGFVTHLLQRMIHFIIVLEHWSALPVWPIPRLFLHFPLYVRNKQSIGNSRGQTGVSHQKTLDIVWCFISVIKNYTF